MNFTAGLAAGLVIGAGTVFLLIQNSVCVFGHCLKF